MKEGWFEDPTGRFRERFFDGAAWTEQVVGANGSVFVDVLPPAAGLAPPDGARDPSDDADEAAAADADGPDEMGDGPRPALPTYPDEPAEEPAVALAWRAPPAATADLPADVNRPVRYVRGAAALPDAAVTTELPAVGPPLGPPGRHPDSQGGGRPAGPPLRPPVRSGAPAPQPHMAGLDQLPGLVVAALGLLCVLLSLLALNWAAGGDGTFLDIGANVRRAGSAAVGNGLVYAYTVWLGWVLFALALVAVALATRPVMGWRSGSAYPRIAGSLLAGLAALLQTLTIEQLFKGPASPHFGAWLGVAGYLIVVVGLVLGTSRRT